MLYKQTAHLQNAYIRGLFVICNQVVRFQRPDATPAKMTSKEGPARESCLARS